MQVVKTVSLSTQTFTQAHPFYSPHNHRTPWPPHCYRRQSPSARHSTQALPSHHPQRPTVYGPARTMPNRVAPSSIQATTPDARHRPGQAPRRLTDKQGLGFGFSSVSCDSLSTTKRRHAARVTKLLQFAGPISRRSGAASAPLSLKKT